MADFETACVHLLKIEDPELKGEVVPEPKGGKARFGINSIAHPELLAKGFYEMPHDQALQVAEDTYKYEYWNPIMGYQIADQDVANKFLDLAVNCGISPATKIVQRAINTVRRVLITVDGVVGSRTIASLNAADVLLLLPAIRAQQKRHYLEIVSADPELEPYLNGWLTRAEA